MIIKKSFNKNVKFGDNVEIVEPVNLYECEIGNNCFIGPYVEIQKKLKLVITPEFRVILLFVS